MARPSVIGRRHYRTPLGRSAPTTAPRASGAPARPGPRRWPPAGPGPRPGPAPPRPGRGDGAPAPRSHRRVARRARGAGAARQRLGVGRVDPRRQLVEQVGLVGQERRPGGPARARGRARRWRWPGGAARGGRGCARSGGRRWTGRCTGSRPERLRTGRGSRTGGCRAAGWAGPGPHARQPVEARPPQEVDEDRLGLVVHGVAGGRALGQGGRGGRRGPGLRDWGRRRRPPARRRKPAPSRAAAAATTSASAAEPGRSPWSTWTAVTAQPAATASASRASESGPPDTAQTRACRGAGTCSAPSSASMTVASRGPAPRPRRRPSACGEAGRSDARHPGLGVADLVHGGKHLRPLPHPVQQLGPARRLHGADEPLPRLVLAHLRLEPDELLEQARRQAGPPAPLAQHPGEHRGVGDGVGAGPVHGDVAVSLEQAHHGLDPADHLELLGRRHQARASRPPRGGSARPAPRPRPGAAPRRSARGSGAMPDMAWSTRDRKWGRNHGTPVNWHRWVTSCRAIHSRNCLAGSRGASRGPRCWGPRRTPRRRCPPPRPAAGRTGPRTRVAIHPRTRPIWAPVARRAAPASGPCRPPVSSFSRTGSSSRRNEVTLARTQPARSSTRAPALPVAGRSPVASITRASARVVASEKSASSWAMVAASSVPAPGGPNSEPRVPTQVATRWATSHDTGLVTAPSVGSRSPPPPSQAIFLPRSLGVLGVRCRQQYSSSL